MGVMQLMLSSLRKSFMFFQSCETGRRQHVTAHTTGVENKNRGDTTLKLRLLVQILHYPKDPKLCHRKHELHREPGLATREGRLSHRQQPEIMIVRRPASAMKILKIISS